MNMSELRRLALVIIQVGLVMFAAFRFEIVSDFGFRRLAPLIVLGFVVHAVLPLRFRPTFFLLLSFAAIGVVLPFPYSIILIAIGLGLFGLCHLPIAFGARVALIIAAALVIAGIRAGSELFPGTAEVGALVMPIIGAMFMFRLAIYLYDLRHEKSPAPLSQRLSYFFMLPNVSFLLFPVIDYQAFRRNYYDKNEFDIYEKGVLWILRGLVHLLLYRIVYQLYSTSPESVTDFGGVVAFMLSTYLLYLRISGQFHLIVGILCLFGYNLPETHKMFYLASGFNDFWRRINIYWKDFMMKIVYYPVFVHLRRFGMMPGMIVATLAVFFGTWILHSYQWFWLRGTFPITATDAIFWGVLAVFVVWNSVHESKSGRKRSLGKVEWSLAEALARAVKTVGFFILMTILWSLWNSATVSQWASMVSNVGAADLADIGLLVVGIVAAILLGVLFQFINSLRRKSTLGGTEHLLINPVAYTIVMSAILLTLTFPQITNHFPATTAAYVDVIQKDRLNVHDQVLAERGYYEDLLDNPSFTSALSVAQGRRPKTQEWEATRTSNVVNETHDAWEYELKASLSESYKGALFETNQWGFRDKEYSLQKPASTHRIAMIGASVEMGGGVTNDEVYEAVLEDNLNRHHADGYYSNHEVLNFSVGGYGMLHKFMIAEQKIDRFEPDMVLLTIFNTEDRRTLGHLAALVSADIEIPYAEIRQIVQQSGARSDMTRAMIETRLRPYVDDVITWSMRRLVELSAERGFTLAAIYMPHLEELTSIVDEPRADRLDQSMQAAGLEPIRVSDIFDGQDLEAMKLSEWDAHFSVSAHKVVGEYLARRLAAEYPCMVESTGSGCVNAESPVLPAAGL
jgi:D-alanyl-lipoteichoic acid acyltransferase DltB (MBOAT superfamily)